MCVVQPCVNACVCPGVCARSAACLKLDRRAAALPLFTCGGKKLQAVPAGIKLHLRDSEGDGSTRADLQEVKHC